MIGTIPPFSHYAFKSWCLVKSVGATLPLPLPFTYVSIVNHCSKNIVFILSWLGRRSLVSESRILH